VKSTKFGGEIPPKFMKKIGGINIKKRLLQVPSLKRQAMRAIANNSVNFFKVDTFNAQGWQFSGGIKRWAPRKDQKDRPGRKILVDTGAGRQSIHTALILPNRVIIRAEAEYMNYHNTGTKNMPQRKFMGDSVKLNKQNIVILVKAMRKAI